MAATIFQLDMVGIVRAFALFALQEVFFVCFCTVLLLIRTRKTPFCTFYRYSTFVLILLMCRALCHQRQIRSINVFARHAFQIFSSLSGNYANLFLMVTATSAGFLSVFLITYFATQVSLQLLQISDISYHSLWYKYPTTLRKYVRFVIQNAQRPQLFRGFKMMSCTLSSFTKVNGIDVVEHQTEKKKNQNLKWYYCFFYYHSTPQLMNTAISSYSMFKNISWMRIYNRWNENLKWIKYSAAFWVYKCWVNITLANYR